MITAEQQGNMEAQKNPDQKILMVLGHDEQTQDYQPPRPLTPPSSQPTPRLDDEHNAVSTGEADEKEEGELSGEELGWTLDNVSEVFNKQLSVEDTRDDVVVVVSPTMEERPEAHIHSPRVMPSEADAESILTVDNSQVSPHGLPDAPLAHDEVVSSPPGSPGKKPFEGASSWKNGEKKTDGTDDEELSLPGVLLNCCDAGAQTDQQELERIGNEAQTGHQEHQRDGLEADPAALHVSEEGVDQERAETYHESVMKSNTSEEGQGNDEGVQHESESPSAVVEREDGEIVADEGPDKGDPSFASLKALRSFGRWADVSEDIDARDTELDRLASQPISLDNQSSGSQEQEHRHTTEQGFERPNGQDIRVSFSVNPNEHGLTGKSQLGVVLSPREDDVRDSPKEQELRGKSQQVFESSKIRSRLDPRADSWTNHKEQDLRGKTQLGSRDSLSQASREPNWRRRPEEPRVRQEMPRRHSKLGLDGDSKTDEYQDFRSRSQYGAEPQATHKNWIPRRGLGARGEAEGRAEQSKARGKGKQGREVEPPNQFSVDSAARLKFEADLRIKKDELYQRSKLTLKAEFQKAKRIEQAKKGGDQLEMELNRNLVCEDGELFYLNI